MYGTFCSWASRILFCIRLSERVDLDPQAARAQDAGQLLGRLDVAVGDRDDDGLDRRQPQRERAGEVLDEDADEPLERAVDRAVDRDRALRLAVLVDVGQVEPLGQHHEVDLDRRHLPFAPEGVVDVDVDLGRVERAVLGLEVVADVGRREGLADQLLGPLPERRVADRLVRLGREREPRRRGRTSE